MEKNTIIIVILAVLLLITAVETAELFSIKSKITGSSVKEANDNSETYEEMMARMHPDQARQNSPTMVGGC